jgi:hypothetical protein
MSNGGSENQSPLVTRHSSLLTASYPALNALLLFFILNLAVQTPTEPDLGWHLRTGLDLISHGWQMPLTDPYSHTMPDWPWVEHAWLTDGLIGLLCQGAGLLGVIALFAAIPVAAGLAAAGAGRAGWTSRLAAVAIMLWVARPFLGARTQMVTLLGVALLLWLWRLVQTGRTWPFWAMPPLFLLWANLHGGFPAGLLTLGVMGLVSVAMRIAADRQPSFASRLDEPVPSWRLIGLLALAIGVSAPLTLVTPYGWRLYQEIYASLSDRFMLETLHEWQPLSLETHAGKLYVGYLAALGIVMGLCYRRVEPVRWAVLAVFLAFSIRHWRNIPFFLIVSLPLCAELVADAAARVAAWMPALAQRPKRWGMGLALAVAVGMVALGPGHLARVAWSGLAPEEFFRDTDYPIEAVQWITASREKVGTRLFNEYGHGGFLLWWLPGERIFIDGRMPAWRIDARHIFEDYIALTSWDPPAFGVLDKYGVDWTLVSRGSPLERALGARTGWQLVYEDAKVRIFVRRME